MANTGTTQIPAAIQNAYDRNLLTREMPELVHDIFGEVRDLDANSSDTLKVRRYEALALATTPLTEGTTPAGKQIVVTDITVTVPQYGDFVTLTDELQMETLDPVVMETTEVLGEQGRQTLDVVTRDVLNAGTNVFYTGAAVSRVTVTAVVTAANLKTATLSLKNSNARKITKFVRPEGGYGTTAVRPSYVAITHINVSDIIQGLTGFEHAEDYANSGTLLPGEVGRLGDIRFVESTQAKVFTGAGASSKDVYTIVILGERAYATTKMKGRGEMRAIVKPLGSGGTEDPIDQRSSVGWKAYKAAVITNQDWIARIETAIV